MCVKCEVWVKLWSHRITEVLDRLQWTVHCLLSPLWNHSQSRQRKWNKSNSYSLVRGKESGVNPSYFLGSNRSSSLKTRSIVIRLLSSNGSNFDTTIFVLFPFFDDIVLPIFRWYGENHWCLDKRNPRECGSIAFHPLSADKSQKVWTRSQSAATSIDFLL